ncbi:hypothetical protein AG1IA_05893 [Rhizoctonia solani AG-1 IA]|uniref:Uncharacterized protein n=1 Tax=Thanatephorus cucumeris (strain AG1-IA) TaxID=983506 RepID=L8WUQ4_THACA|nr:hypothetical protein AG1IA_05893 [Rhizoctonia solani AG-1 IA]
MRCARFPPRPGTVPFLRLERLPRGPLRPSVNQVVTSMMDALAQLEPPGSSLIPLLRLPPRYFVYPSSLPRVISSNFHSPPLVVESNPATSTQIKPKSHHTRVDPS